MKDLHIHTKYSDGEYDKFEILKRIKLAGISEFAICDHDTIEGSKKISEILKNQKSNLIFHSGVELTSRVNNIFNGVNVHLLARDFDYNEPNILNLINEISVLRKKKINRMVDYIYKIYGIRLKDDEVNEIARKTNSVGKPHIYKLLCNHGNFDRLTYYKNMDSLNSYDLRLDAVKVLNSVHNGKGNVTLAHPKEIMREYNFTYNDIDKLVAFLVNFGLDGLETKHSLHTDKDYEQFSKIAKKYNLFETCGSDYHGETVKPNVFLGICKPTDIKKTTTKNKDDETYEK